MTRILLFVLLALALAAPALAQQGTSPRIDLGLAPGAPSPASNTGAPDKTAAPAPVPIDKSRFTLFDPPPTQSLRGFAPDRPTKSYAPVTVDAGHVQYETDILAYTHTTTPGLSTRQFTAFDPLVKLGLTDRVEFGLQFGGYDWADSRVPGTSAVVSRVRGVGDLTLRPKINVFGNEGGPALAVIPYVKFPTASRNLGNGHVDGGVILPVSVPLPWDFTVTVVPEVDVLRNGTNAGHHVDFTQAFSVGHPVGKAVTLYAEFFSSVGPDHGSPNLYTADVAAAWLVTDTLQLDVGANFGLNKAAPNVQAYTGVAQRF